MASQQDLDQGGTFRQWVKLWLGPSVGFVWAMDNSLLRVDAAGTVDVNRSVSLIMVNMNGTVTLNLPSSKANSAGAGVIPGDFTSRPLQIMDVGGFAFVHPITIVPFGSETIDSLPSLQIATAYGAFTLFPLIETGGWTLTQ